MVSRRMACGSASKVETSMPLCTAAAHRKSIAPSSNARVNPVQLAKLRCCDIVAHLSVMHTTVSIMCWVFQLAVQI